MGNALKKSVELDPQRDIIALAKAKGQSVAWISSRVGLHRDTVIKRLREPAVLRKVEEYQRNMYEQTRAILMNAAPNAAKGLVKGIKGEASKEQISSAIAILDRVGVGPKKEVELSGGVTSKVESVSKEELIEMERELVTSLEGGVIDAID